MAGTTISYKAPQTLQKRDITPSFIREELIKCIESANREFAESLNRPISNRVLKDQVREHLIAVFANCNTSYRNPTREGIIGVIGRCKTNAEEIMGTQGKEILEQHYKEIMKLVNQLPPS